MSAAASTAHLAVGWVRQIAGPIRRVASLLCSVSLTFLGLTCVTFFIGRVIPIDPVLAIVGQQARAGLGGNFQQEIDLQTLFKDVAHEFVEMATVPDS